MMRRRVATSRDLHRLTEITTSSLVDDPTYDYLYPGRRRFSEDNSTWMRLRLESFLYNKRATFLVVELDVPHSGADQVRNVPGATQPAVGSESSEKTLDPEQQCSVIISYGIWVRMGNDAAAKERMAKKDTWVNALDAMTMKVNAWSIDRKFTRRDADPARLAAKASTFEAFKREFFGDSPDWWSLELLVTHRDFRRRGAATQIVKWGTEQADIEHVASGIEASPMGAPVYRSQGYKTLATWTIHVDGDDASLDEECMRREASQPSLP